MFTTIHSAEVSSSTASRLKRPPIALPSHSQRYACASSRCFLCLFFFYLLPFGRTFPSFSLIPALTHSTAAARAFSTLPLCSIMDSLPPNDPNRNHHHPGAQHHPPSKEDPTGRENREQQRGGATIPFIDPRDSPAVAAILLITIVQWMLRDPCVC